MKKILFVLGVAVIAAVACEKSIEPGSDIKYNPDGSYTMTIRANASDMTKTAYAGDVTFSWSAGDEISVLFHDGDGNNVFKTFTTASGGTTATFTGTVEGGLTIGAYDDVLADNNGIKWALYPADSGHTFTKGAANPISFNVPSETDFSSRSSYEIAPIPMWAQGDGSNNFSFKHLSKCYKFTFTNMDVSKVKMTITHTADGYYLSGTSKINGSGSDLYLECYSGSGTTTVSQTVNVNPSTKTATFYIPCRKWCKLQPNITLFNMDAGANYGNTLLSASAKARFTDDVGTGVIVPVPSTDVKGVGVPFISKFGIDWDSPLGSTAGTSPMTEMKVASDASYLYMLLKMDATGIQTDPSYNKANLIVFYVGDSSSASAAWFWNNDTYTSNISLGWNLRYGSWVSPNSDAIVLDGQSLRVGDDVYTEMKLDRSANTILSTGGSVKLGVLLYYESIGDSWGSVYSPAPAKNSSMLSVTLPAYVAP